MISERAGKVALVIRFLKKKKRSKLMNIKQQNSLFQIWTECSLAWWSEEADVYHSSMNKSLHSFEKWAFSKLRIYINIILRFKTNERKEKNRKPNYLWQMWGRKMSINYCSFVNIEQTRYNYNLLYSTMIFVIIKILCLHSTVLPKGFITVVTLCVAVIHRHISGYRVSHSCSTELPQYYKSIVYN